MLVSVILGLILLLFSPFEAHARTWHVLPNGTGDVPTIQVAIDSSAPGDTVLLGRGQFEDLGSIDLKSGIFLRSAEGAEACTLSGISLRMYGREVSAFTLAGVTFQDVMSPMACSVFGTNNRFEDCVWRNCCGGLDVDNRGEGEVVVRGCVFEGMSSSALSFGGDVRVVENRFSGNQYAIGYATGCEMTDPGPLVSNTSNYHFSGSSYPSSWPKAASPPLKGAPSTARHDTTNLPRIGGDLPSEANDFLGNCVDIAYPADARLNYWGTSSCPAIASGFGWNRGNVVFLPFTDSTHVEIIDTCMLPCGQVHTVPGDYPDIQSAVDVAEGTDTVLIAGGVYQGDVTVGKSGLTILGAEGEWPVIEGDSVGLLLSSSYVLVKNVVIRSALGRSDFIGVDATAHPVRIDHTMITDGSRESGKPLGRFGIRCGGSVWSFDGDEIDHCTISGFDLGIAGLVGSSQRIGNSIVYGRFMEPCSEPDSNAGAIGPAEEGYWWRPGPEETVPGGPVFVDPGAGDFRLSSCSPDTGSGGEYRGAYPPCDLCPPMPPERIGVVETDRGVVLTWDKVEGAASYVIMRTIDCVWHDSLAIVAGDQIAYLDTSVTDADSVSYRLVAIDSSGLRSDLSEPSAKRTPHTWHVDSGGDGDALTIQGALDLAFPGDTILIASGTYHEHDMVLKPGVYMTSEAADPESVIVDAGASGRVFRSDGLTDTTTIVGLTIGGGNVPGAGLREGSGGGILCVGSVLNIVECKFLDNVADGPGGAVSCKEGHVEIRNCWFERNASDSLGGAVHIGDQCVGLITYSTFRENNCLSGGAVASDNSSSVTIRYCVFDQNSSSGRGGAVACADESHVEVQDCTFYGNSGADGGGGIDCGSTSSVYVNNCVIAFSEVGEAVLCEETGTVVLQCCDLYGNAGGDWVGYVEGQFASDGNISLAPLFCDPENGDFRVQRGSPCVESPDCWLIGAKGSGCEGPRVWFVPTDAPTIRAAVDSTRLGDTVLVACGTYYESDIDMKPGIALRSEAGDAGCVTIDADSLGRILTCSSLDSAALIEGFTLTGVRLAEHDSYRVAVYSTGSSIRFVNCTFEQNEGDLGGGITGDGSDLFLTNCSFIRNRGAFLGSALFLSGSRVVMENCAFDQNKGPGGAVFCQGGNHVTVHCCTFCGNDRGLACSNIDSADTLTMENTLLAFNEGAAIHNEYSPFVASAACCNIYGNEGGDWVGSIEQFSGIAGNLSRDPLFCAATNGVLTIDAASPCSRDSQPACGLIGAYGVGCDSGIPDSVVSFLVEPADGENALSWTAPRTIDLEGVLIRYSTVGFPSSVDSGIAIPNGYEGRFVCEPGDDSVFVHAGLRNGITYYYSIWAYDDDENYSTAMRAEATPHDSTPPELALGILQNPYLSQHLDLYVVGSENLDGNSIVMVLDGRDTVAVREADEDQNVWAGDFTLTASMDTVRLRCCAADVDGNSVCDSTVFSATLVKAVTGGTAMSPDGKVSLTVGPGVLDRDVFVLVHPLELNHSIKNRVMQGTKSDATLLSRGMKDGEKAYYELGPLGVLRNGRGEVTLQYSHTDLAGEELTCLYVKRIGTGRMESFLDPEAETVAAMVSELGVFRLASGSSGSSMIVDPRFLLVRPNFPNPFNPETTIQLEIHQRQHVSATIYDVAGRSIVRLLDETLGPGHHEMTWNGRMAEGNEVASGVYFCRVSTEHKTLSRKMILIR